MGIVRWITTLGSNTLYFPGCLTKAVLKEELENYKKIFNILDIAFVTLSDEEVCCGLVALHAGYKKDARKLANKNYELFKKNNISKIITNCPSCYYMFKEVYPQLVREWDIDVEHAIIEILKGLKRKGINLNGEKNPVETVVYHDSCTLGRYCGIYDEPRQVIHRLGGKILEMKTSKKNALCCGAEGGVINNFPELAKKAALLRVEESPSKEHRIISASGLCHYAMKRVTEKSIEISSFILEKLNFLPS